VPYQSLETTWGVERISQVRVFGLGDIMFQQLDGMKKLSEITFVIKNQKIVE
jgi:hypothetical protein